VLSGQSVSNPGIQNKSSETRWAFLSLLSLFVASLIPLYSVSADEPAALGPFFGVGQSGSLVVPSKFSAADLATERETNNPIRRGYQFDKQTINNLKANPPTFPTRAPLQIEDANIAVQELSAKAPSEPQGFQGITNTGSIPPDNGLAAGPNHVLEMVNSTWRVFTKTGAVATASHPFCGTGGWWTSKLPSAVTDCFDPRVFYDQSSSRWVMTAAARSDSLQSSWYLIATSTSADPTGSWCTYALDAKLDGSTPTSNWADFPALGLDNQAFYITSNQFNFNDEFQYAKLRILGKQQFYNNTCQTPTWTDLTHLQNPDGSDAFTVMPAQTFGVPATQPLVSSDSVSGTSITLWSLANPLSSPSLTRVSVPVASYGLPPNAEQCGNATPLDTGDARLLNAVYRNGTL
jgi:hypothetical protein